MTSYKKAALDVKFNWGYKAFSDGYEFHRGDSMYLSFSPRPDGRVLWQLCDEGYIEEEGCIEDTYGCVVEVMEDILESYGRRRP